MEWNENYNLSLHIVIKPFPSIGLSPLHSFVPWHSLHSPNLSAEHLLSSSSINAHHYCYLLFSPPFLNIGMPILSCCCYWCSLIPSQLTPSFILLGSFVIVSVLVLPSSLCKNLWSSCHGLAISCIPSLPVWP